MKIKRASYYIGLPNMWLLVSLLNYDRKKHKALFYHTWLNAFLMAWGVIQIPVFLATSSSFQMQWTLWICLIFNGNVCLDWVLFVLTATYTNCFKYSRGNFTLFSSNMSLKFIGPSLLRTRKALDLCVVWIILLIILVPEYSAFAEVVQ